MITLLSAWLLADFLSGLGHWAEDRLLLKPSRFKLLNQIKSDNDLHHLKPAEMIKLSPLGNISTTAPVTIPLSIALWFIGAPVILWLSIFFLSFANLIHRWAHMAPRRLPRIVRLLQRSGLFISMNQHNQHHFKKGKPISKEDTTKCYCVMSAWLNPVLDRVKFFERLERIVKG